MHTAYSFKAHAFSEADECPRCFKKTDPSYWTGFVDGGENLSAAAPVMNFTGIIRASFSEVTKFWVSFCLPASSFGGLMMSLKPPADYSSVNIKATFALFCLSDTLL